MLVLAFSQTYTRVFHLWKCIEIDSGWVGDSRPCQFSFLLRIPARLAVRHTCVFGTGIPHDAYLTF